MVSNMSSLTTIETEMFIPTEQYKSHLNDWQMDHRRHHRLRRRNVKKVTEELERSLEEVVIETDRRCKMLANNNAVCQEHFNFASTCSG